MAFFFGQKTTKPAVYKAESVFKKSVSIQKYTKNIPSDRKNGWHNEGAGAFLTGKPDFA
jgi:hypothetical protein